MSALVTLLNAAVMVPGEPPAPSDVEAGQCVVPQLGDRVGVRPLQGAFAEVAALWGLPLCSDDYPLDPAWHADTKSLSEGDRTCIIHEIPLEGVRLTSTRDVAEQILAIDQSVEPLLRYELRPVGACLTATVVARLAPDNVTWDPVAPVLDRRVRMDEVTTLQQGLGSLVAALEATGLEMDDHPDGYAFESGTNDPAVDRPCRIPSGRRVARDVLGALLGCASVDHVATFVLRADGTTWDLRVNVVDPLLLFADVPEDEDGKGGSFARRWPRSCGSLPRPPAVDPRTAPLPVDGARARGH